MSRPCLRNLAAVLVLASSAGAPLWSMMKGAAKAAELDAVPLFSLESHLACSAPARALISWRLAQWDQETDSVTALVRAKVAHHMVQFQLLRQEVQFESKRRDGSHGRDEDCISNARHSLLKRQDASFVKNHVPELLPELDLQLVRQMLKGGKFGQLVMGIRYDDVSLESIAPLEAMDLECAAWKSTRPILERAEQDPATALAPSYRNCLAMLDHLQSLHEVDCFILDWLQGQRQRMREDLKLLARAKDDPSIILAAGVLPTQAREADADHPDAPVEPAETKVESKTPAAVGCDPGDGKAAVAAGAGKPGAGAPRPKDLDPFYRFVACTARTRPIPAQVRLSKANLAIREEVELRSMDLTSTKVQRLVKALEPYGARCEPDRKKGIMVKLPARDPGKRFVAKLIHRTHASHDSMDIHSVEALKQLFDESVFTIDKFREGAPES